MPTKILTLTREELHQKVWSAPLSHLASEFGISDVAIGKICKKFNIPKPRMGYWQMIQHGRKLKVSSLPPTDRGMSNEIQIVRSESRKFQVQDEAIGQQIESLSRSEGKIAVQPVLLNPHPLVTDAKTLLEKGSPGEFGYLVPKSGAGQSYLDVRVSRNSLGRTLRIMNAILITLQTRGYIAEVQKERPFHTYVRVGKETVKFRLAELIQRSPREMTPAELARPHYDPSIRWNFNGSGLLTFKIDEYYPEHSRKTWADSEHRSLETQLNEIVIGILKSGEAMRLRTMELGELEKKRQETRRKEEEEANLAAAAAQQEKELESVAQSWIASKNINVFLDAVEKLGLAAEHPTDLEDRLSTWLSWARNYARRLDPLEASNLKRLIDTATRRKEGV